MITPWLRLFRAELMKTLRRSCAFRMPRNAEGILIAIEARKAQTTMAAIAASHTKFGAISARWRDAGNSCGSAQAGAIGVATAAKPAMARAGMSFLAPARQIVPAINHPRISARDCLASRVWIG